MRANFTKRHRHRLYALSIGIVAFAIFSNTLNHQFAWDDEIVIQGNQHVLAGIDGIDDIFNNFNKRRSDRLSDQYGFRPLTLTTYALEIEFFGEKPEVGHFNNVLIYACLCMLLYLLLVVLAPNAPPALLWLSVLLFAVHPLHVESVANIKGRDDILSLLFATSATIVAVRFASKSWLITLFFSPLLLFAGVLSKENAAVFAGIIPFAMVCFSRPKTFVYLTIVPILWVVAFHLLPLETTLKVLMQFFGIAAAYLHFLLQFDFFKAAKRSRIKQSWRKQFAQMYLAMNSLSMLWRSLIARMALNAKLAIFRMRSRLILILRIKNGRLELSKWPVFGLLLFALPFSLILAYGLYESQETHVLFGLFSLAVTSFFIGKKSERAYLICITFAVTLICMNYGIYEPLRLLYTINLYFLFNQQERKKKPLSIGTLIVLVLADMFVTEFGKPVWVYTFISLVSYGVVVKKRKLALVPLIVLTALVAAESDFFGALFGLGFSIVLLIAYLAKSRVRLLPFALVICSFLAFEMLTVPQSLIAHYRYELPADKKIEPPTLAGWEYTETAQTDLNIDQIELKSIGLNETEGQGIYIESQILGNPLIELEGIDRLMNAINVLGYYAQKSLWPGELHYYSGFDFWKPIALTSWRLWVAVLVLLILMFAAIASYRANRLISFSVFLYFVTIGLYSHLFVALPDAVADRFAFTASFGMVLFFVGTLHAFFGFLSSKLTKSIQQNSLPLKLTSIICGLLVLLFAIQTHDRNKDWKNNYTLFSADIGKLDECARAHFHYAGALSTKYLAGNPSQELKEKIVKHYRKSIAISKESYYAYVNLGKMYFNFGEWERALNTFEELKAAFPDQLQGYYQSGYVQYFMKDYSKSIENLKKGIEIAPERNKNYLFLAWSTYFSGQAEEAIQIIENRLTQSPYDTELIEAISDMYFGVGDEENGLKYLHAILAFDPYHIEALRKMVLRHTEMGNLEEAKQYIERLPNSVGK